MAAAPPPGLLRDGRRGTVAASCKARLTAGRHSATLPLVTLERDEAPALESQRAEIEAAFRECWVSPPGSEPKLLTERDYAEALRFIAQPGKTWLAGVAIQAVRDGAQPGDPIPHDRFLSPTPTPEVIIIGRGPGQRVAVLFSQEDAPRVQFGHRFELHIPGGNRAAVIRLIEQVQAGGLRQAMPTHRSSMGAAITWTPWGTPSSEPELEHQLGRITAAFTEGWRPAGSTGPRVLTEHYYAEARKILDRGGWTGLDQTTIQAVRGGAQPGDALPPLPPRPFIDHVTNADVILHGSGAGQRVAVLFCHEHFPDARFGHRFRLEPFGNGHEDILLMEEIDTGALHRMMDSQPSADSAGIIWTTWGSPAPRPG